LSIGCTCLELYMWLLRPITNDTLYNYLRRIHVHLTATIQARAELARFERPIVHWPLCSGRLEQDTGTFSRFCRFCRFWEETVQLSPFLSWSTGPGTSNELGFATSSVTSRR
jgi:hypothetical protein